MHEINIIILYYIFTFIISILINQVIKKSNLN